MIREEKPQIKPISEYTSTLAGPRNKTGIRTVKREI